MWYRRPFWQTSAFPLGLALLIVSALSNLLPDRAWGQAAAPPLPPGALAPLTSPIPRVLPPEQPEIVPPAAPAGEPAAPPPEGPPVRVDQIRVEGGHGL